MGVCAVFWERRHLYLNVPDRFRFSVSVTVPQMCFLPENKSGTSLFGLFYRQYREEEESCKWSVRPTVVLRWSVTHSHNMPDPWPLLHIPRQNCRKLTENSGISSFSGCEFWKRQYHTISMQRQTISLYFTNYNVQVTNNSARHYKQVKRCFMNQNSQHTTKYPR